MRFPIDLEPSSLSSPVRDCKPGNLGTYLSSTSWDTTVSVKTGIGSTTRDFDQFCHLGLFLCVLPAPPVPSEGPPPLGFQLPTFFTPPPQRYGRLYPVRTQCHDSRVTLIVPVNSPGSRVLGQGVWSGPCPDRPFSGSPVHRVVATVGPLDLPSYPFPDLRRTERRPESSLVLSFSEWSGHVRRSCTGTFEGCRLSLSSPVGVGVGQWSSLLLSVASDARS